MKLHCSKIYLLFLELNILVTSYQVYSKNKPSITSHHTPIYTSRVLSECDTQSSNYNKDTGMKSVMQQFDDRTSQRFQEYDERLQEKRQKRKEERDKNIQKIIEEDKKEKSLTEKIEKGCLKCGCGLGGGVLPVWGLICGAGYAGWTNYVATTVAEAAMDAGMNVIKETLKTLGVEKLIPEILKGISSIDDFSKVANFSNLIETELRATCAATSSSAGAIQPGVTEICRNVMNETTGGTIAKSYVSGALKQIAGKAPQAAKTTEGIEAAKYTSTTSSLTTGIPASIIAIIIIVLIMVIIYLILRYRRKKKMKKKLQYIKLLEE
ncbi:rifin PIR protein,putative [Plasmodium sp. DRC-Itaito]|nr:rifin PIR protein,putative [Plasmodium sp. DRC-Itaito]